MTLPPPLRRRFVECDSGREAPSLLEFAGFADIDPGGAADLVGFGFQLGRRTLLAGVERRADPWHLDPPEPHPASLDSTDARADRLWELLGEAVRRAAVGARAPRVPLSGGLDSRAVAAVAADLRGLTAGTFGDPECNDMPVARQVAQALGLSHSVTRLPIDAALATEKRVWVATGGLGGPAAAPGAYTDRTWATDCDRLLSGTSGEVVWGDARRPTPLPDSRLRKLGIRGRPQDPAEAAPEPPEWASPPGREAWINLWTRQAGASWNGVLPRLASTPVVPIPWDPAVLSYCLALGKADRLDRALLRRMLDRCSPALAGLTSVRGTVHDLDRAMRTCVGWQSALEEMVARSQAPVWRCMGIDARAVRRLVRQQLRGTRDRAQLLSRLRVMWRWGRLLGG